jgi:SAM-dependent methyltransferase
VTTHDPGCCNVCGAAGGDRIHAREMMFGTREPFTYLECSGCGGLRLLDVPADLSRHYPKEYYSFEPPPPIPPRSVVKRWLNRSRNAGAVFGHNLFSRILSSVSPGPSHRLLAEMLQPTRLRSLHAKVLDVGCGGGDLLADLCDLGFAEVVGVDPYATRREDAAGRLRVLPISIDQLAETGFDLVMSHHSLEHVADQVGTLRHMHRVLKPGGSCLVRMPVASSEVWQRYRHNWVELDPPRHFFIHTRRSFEIAASAAGFQLDAVLYDDTGFGYWGSELYMRDVPLYSHSAGRMVVPTDWFDANCLAEFNRLAHNANQRSEGGRAAFYLRKM